MFCKPVAVVVDGREDVWSPSAVAQIDPRVTEATAVTTMRFRVAHKSEIELISKSGAVHI